MNLKIRKMDRQKSCPPIVRPQGQSGKETALNDYSFKKEQREICCLLLKRMKNMLPLGM
jgi:hypothetical protein